MTLELSRGLIGSKLMALVLPTTLHIGRCYCHPGGTYKLPWVIVRLK